jgi:hypothetical protein
LPTTAVRHAQLPFGPAAIWLGAFPSPHRVVSSRGCFDPSVCTQRPSRWLTVPENASREPAVAQAPKSLIVGADGAAPAATPEATSAAHDAMKSNPMRFMIPVTLGDIIDL